MVQNVTMGGMNAMASMSPTAIMGLVSTFIFIGIIVTLFILYKNFRRCLYGLSVLVPVSIIGWISYGTGKSTSTGNYIPMIIIGGSIAVIIVSILIGMLIEKTKWAKKIEKNIN